VEEEINGPHVSKVWISGAILLSDNPFWYHWHLDKALLMMSSMMVAAFPTTHICPWAIAMMQSIAPSVVFAHIGAVQRSMGFVAFLLLVILPFFVVGAVDGVGLAANESSDVALGVARAVAFFLFFFFLAMVGGMASRGGRAGGTMMTSTSFLGDSAM
jgi:hypothetical protein